LLVGTLLALGVTLLDGAVRGKPPRAEDEHGGQAGAERVVFIAGNLPPDGLIPLTTAVAAGSQSGVVLLDSPKSAPYARRFLAAFHPDRVIPIGSFPDGIGDLQSRLGVTAAPALAWEQGPPNELWRVLFPRAARVVVCPQEPRGLLLEAACLAGIEQAPLFVLSGRDGEAEDLRCRLTAWGTRTIDAAGEAAAACRAIHGVTVHELADEQAVSDAYLRRLLRGGRVDTVVVANPEDTRDGLGGTSALAPWVALQRRAVLLCTDAAGDNVEAVVRAALERPHLKDADALILAADLKAIPMRRRPNPIPTDRDEYIEMEPFTPDGAEPFTFATGRLFHEDNAVVALMLARERLLAEARPSRKALVVSNAGGGLPLLETFSRNTVQELRNSGYETRALFGKEATADSLRRLLPEYDLFLWEGHHNTLIQDWGFPDWDEPLPPSLVFLQSCLALHEWKAQPLLRRGAVGVVGSSTRIYSASGGACSLAFFDALLYDDCSVGGALRQAKNFLVTYAQLKERLLGKDARRSGANLRSAWAFTLWGDPTLRLPRPEPPPAPLPAVRHEVQGNTIVVALPSVPHDKVSTTRYQAQMWPNGRLAGLIRKDDDDEGHPLVPFVFVEVALPKAPPDRVPRLHTRLPSSHWVFCWDERRRAGYLLAIPRARDHEDLRFHVEWVPVASVTEEPVEAGGD
jgi:hypothetical protein